MEKLPLYDTREIRVEGDVYLQIDKIFKEPKPFNEVHRALKNHSTEEVKNHLQYIEMSSKFYTGLAQNVADFLHLLQHESEDFVGKFVSFIDMSYLNIALYIEVDEVFIRYAYTSDYVSRFSPAKEQSDVRKLKEKINVDLEALMDTFNASKSAHVKMNILKQLTKYTDVIPFRNNTFRSLENPFDSYASNLTDDYVMSKERLEHVTFAKGKPKFNVAAPFRTVAHQDDLIAIWMLYLQQQSTTHHLFFTSSHLLYLLKKHVSDPRSIKFVKATDNPKYFIQVHASKLSVKFRDDAAKKEFITFLTKQLDISVELVERFLRTPSVINLTFLMLYLTGEVYIDIDYIPPVKNFAKPYKKILNN